MRRVLRFIASVLLLLSIAALAILFSGRVTVEQSARFSNIDQALALYRRALAVKPSRMGAEEFVRIINDRLDCYDQAVSPMDRSRLCNTTYVDRIIRNARHHVKAMPDLGPFIEQVQLCPMVYSMCIGGTSNRNSCITMEHQCIDAALDRYWRGGENPLGE